MSGVIDPNAIPIPKADPDAVEDAGRELKKDGTAIAQTGDDIHSDWQGLNEFYKAPHEELLYAATAPIAAAGHDFKDDVTIVGDALVTFAGEIRPLITRLNNLKGDAQQFRSDIAGDDDWRKDEDKVEEHNQLNDDILAAIAQYQEAERNCANKITGIFGGTKFVPADGDPKNGEKGYGLGDVPEGIETPWAKPQEYDAPWYEDAWNGVKDFGVGLVTDLADMVGIHGENGWVWEEDSHFWSNLGNNWMGVLEDTAGLVGLHGENGWVWEEDSHFWSNLGNNWKEVAHSFVPWREWDDRPGYVITSSILNIGSIFVGVGAVRAGVKLLKRGDADSPDGPDRSHGDRDGDGRLDSDEVGFDDNPSTTDLQNELNDLDIDTGDLQDSLDDMDDLQDAPDREPAHVGGNENGQNPEGSSNGGDSGGDSPGGDTTPDGNGNAPEGNGNPPEGDGNAPEGNGNAPEGDGNAPEGNGNAPEGNGNAPEGDGNAPDGDGNAPDGDGNTPEGDGNAPEGDGNAPEGDGNAPDGDGNAPDGDGNAPEGDGNAPEGDGQAPEGDGDAPDGDGDAQPDPQKVAKAERLEQALRDAGLSDEEIDRLRGDNPRDGDAWQRAASALDQKFGKKVLNARPELNSDAARFALDGGGAVDPREFAYRYEYFKSRFDEQVRSVTEDIKSGDLDLNGRSKIQVGLERFDELDLTEELRQDVDAVRGERPGHADVDTDLPEGERVDALRRQAGDIDMGSDTSTAYHARKHYDELPESERTGDVVRDYLNSAERTIREGDVVKRSMLDNGAERLVFHRTVTGANGRPITLEALVIIRPDGRVVMPTFGGAKGV
ncbi:hypothetical protein HUT06_14540 [Actinomadura sp. NAK00032]|uniref:hypothetical protein n=1 Tax=Actinomadura sp. NAK00032 TaxID=2742128 RepID=UPI0015904156|nr:hypothetical protein [Actinomadura sp. NAK00032]QKW35099.1 hypothetical protein HUT06_14540 [Actinomadura sp. NAK00032]